MAYEHESGIPKAYDRAVDHPEWQSLVFSGEQFIQSAELNEVQTVVRGRHNRLGDLIAHDGDRTDGATAVVLRDPNPMTVIGQLLLTEGRIYIGGDVLYVAPIVIDNVSLVGQVDVGVRITRQWIDSEDDPSLLGLVEGSLAEGEPGAAREKISIAWALATDGGAGDFVPVLTMQDGTIVDQTTPSELEGINQAIAIYDRAHGSYIVRGCRVTALGKLDDSQIFSIEEGEANVNGFKRTRTTALRYAAQEDFSVESVVGEVVTWPGGSSATFNTNHFPIAAVNSVLVTKQVTETVTRGNVAGGADALAHNSVITILEVKQGGTTYTATTDWIRTGDAVDWSPGGAEPATASSYTVKYQYFALVTPDTTTDTSITVSGGVTGTSVVLGYDFKLPRIDVMCLAQDGTGAYIKGISARENPLPPPIPAGLLKLAEVTNSWMAKPTVVNSGIRSVPYEELWHYLNRIIDHERLLQLERIKNAIDSREPVAKKGIFADPLTGDEFRDEGEAQTASVGDGVIELAITPTFFTSTLSAPVMLDYVEQVIIKQEFVTACMKINPYQNFDPLPGALTLNPPVDFWVEKQTVWASPRTLEFNRGVARDNGVLVVTNTSTKVIDNREEQLEFLRQIAVAFTIKGFGPGEVLDSLTFDGVDVKPAGTQTANGSGVINGNFTIPSNMTAGSKLVKAVGQGGTACSAVFSGGGVVEITTMRKTTTVERWTERIGELPFISATHGGQGDPLAQTFTPVEPRQVVGIDFRICHIGSTANDLLVHQVSVENGIPTEDVFAEAFVDMAGASVGWKSARYKLPVLTLDDRASAVVIKTDDGSHSLSVADLGGFDTIQQKYVGAQPYTTGVLLSSSNAQTWTPHQNRDLTFRVVAARFTSTTKTVSLGSFNLVNASDLQVRADVELPSADCSVTFEIVRADASVIKCRPYQVIQLKEFITETVQLRAVLKGTSKLSPVLYAPVVLIAGRIATSGTYVSRAMDLGTGVQLTSYFKAKLPAGSTVNMQYDKVDDTWISLPLVDTEALSDPAWVEQKREATGITAVQGRLKITITGGPAARPFIGDLGAAIM